MPTPVLFALVVAGTVIGLAGTDLVLPAIPGLPDLLAGSLEEAQLVLAAFTAGTAAGLLVFGELGARYNQKQLLVAALLGYGLFSALATLSSSITELSICRLFQGFVASAPAVFAPGMIRSMFDDRRALRALGLMGSIESLVPALAPVLGAWMLNYYDWRASFVLTAVLAFVLSVLWIAVPWFTAPRFAAARLETLQATGTPGRTGSYSQLLMSPTFQRYSLSQAFTLGGLLIFVFGAPTVMIVAMGGTLSDFVTMQVIGISLFVVTTNLAHHAVDAWGAEKTVMAGSTMCALGSLSLLAYSFTGQPDPAMIWLLFSFVNVGLGLRGPAGFYQAIVASGQDVARGAALVMLSVFITVAAGTAALAPYITLGLTPLAGVASAVSVSSVIVLLVLPGLDPSKD